MLFFDGWAIFLSSSINLLPTIMKIPFRLSILALLSLSLSNLSWADEVNIYSARKEALIKPLLDKFTQQTGIEVNLVTGKADALIKRLQSEGRNSPADVLITTDAGRLHRAKAANLLQPVVSAVIEKQVPAKYRDPEGYWTGLSVRSRVIMFNKEKVDPAELSTYEDLAASKWKRRICVRSSNNIYNQSLVASMIAANGEESTAQWAKGLVANLARPPRGGDRDQIKAVAAGQCDIALANTYYLAKMIHSGKAEQLAVTEKIGVFWPNQKDRGAHVNISGAGITAHAANREQAVKLLEFLVSDAAQKWYAESNQEYPVRANVPVSEILAQWGSFKSDAINLAELGKNNTQAVKIMDRAGWR